MFHEIIISTQAYEDGVVPFHASPFFHKGIAREIVLEAREEGFAERFSSGSCRFQKLRGRIKLAGLTQNFSNPKIAGTILVLGFVEVREESCFFGFGESDFFDKSARGLLGKPGRKGLVKVCFRIHIKLHVNQFMKKHLNEVRFGSKHGRDNRVREPPRCGVSGNGSNVDIEPLTSKF